MNYILLVAYYKLIEFCRRNRIYNVLIDDEYTEHYIREVALMSQRDVPRDTINVERIETSLLEE
jgi:hypothetical protein